MTAKIKWKAKRKASLWTLSWDFLSSHCFQGQEWTFTLIYILNSSIKHEWDSPDEVHCSLLKQIDTWRKGNPPKIRRLDFEIAQWKKIG